jgi:hypothetical protein
VLENLKGFTINLTERYNGIPNYVIKDAFNNTLLQTTSIDTAYNYIANASLYKNKSKQKNI